MAIVGSGAVLMAIFVAGLVLGITLFFSEADKSNQDPSNGDNPLKIAAVGDGWMSGEGAAAFFPGTDRPGQNQCRRTSTSFPYIAARMLELPGEYDGVAVQSFACSGATTRNVIPFEGLECTDEGFPDGCPAPQFERRADGRRDPAYQVERVSTDTDVVLVMVGAGDVQLQDVIALCTSAHDPCASVAGPWAESFGSVLEWRLTATYAAIAEQAPSAQIFAVTYPDPFYRETCGRTRLAQDEIEFLSGTFISHLNDGITNAASAAGVRVIDLTEALVGHRLCQPDDADGLRPTPAVNSFQIRPVRGITSKLSSWFHGSFHPTEYGHVLMAEKVAENVEGALEGGGRSRVNPTIVPASFRTGPDEFPYQSESPCGEVSVSQRTEPRPAGNTFSIADVDAGTTVCYRAVADRWSSVSAVDGDVVVPLDAAGRNGFGGWHEVLFRSGSEWTRLTVVAPADSGTSHLTLGRAWLWTWLVVVGGIVGHPVIFVTLVALVLTGALMWCTRRKRPPKNQEPAYRMTRRGAGR